MGFGAKVWWGYGQGLGTIGSWGSVGCHSIDLLPSFVLLHLVIFVHFKNVIIVMNVAVTEFHSKVICDPKH